MEEILKWFADPSRTFEAGRDLYLKYGRNKNIKDLLIKERRGRDFLIRKLEHELQKILPTGSLPKSPVQPVETNPVELPHNGDRKPHEEEEKTPTGNAFRLSELPGELQDKYAWIKENYPLLATFHEKMKQAQSDEDRDKWRDEMLQVEDQIIAHWKDIDTFLIAGAEPNTGKVNEPPTNIVERIAELTKRQQTINDSITRAQRELNKDGLTEKKIENRKASIKKYEQQLRDIEKELEELNGLTR